MRCFLSWASVASAAGASVLGLIGCRNATSIELQISTDLRCEDVRVVTTSIGSGSLETYETRPPSAVTTRCDETTGHIGSLVLLPNQDDRAEVAVRVITARKSKAPEECIDRADAECIVAHRVVRFVPHRAVTLPIRMQDVCSGVTCGPRETCTNGRCVSSMVQIDTCPPEGCEADLPANAAPPDAGASPPSSGGSGPPDAGEPFIFDAGVPPGSNRDAGRPTQSGKGDAGAKPDKGDKPNKPDKPDKPDNGGDTPSPTSSTGSLDAGTLLPRAVDAGANTGPPAADAGDGDEDEEADEGDEDGGGNSGNGKPKKPKKPTN